MEVVRRIEELGENDEIGTGLMGFEYSSARTVQILGLVRPWSMRLARYCMPDSVMSKDRIFDITYLLPIELKLA